MGRDYLKDKFMKSLIRAGIFFCWRDREFSEHSKGDIVSRIVTWFKDLMCPGKNLFLNWKIKGSVNGGKKEERCRIIRNSAIRIKNFGSIVNFLETSRRGFNLIRKILKFKWSWCQRAKKCKNFHGYIIPNMFTYEKHIRVFLNRKDFIYDL